MHSEVKVSHAATGVHGIEEHLLCRLCQDRTRNAKIEFCWICI